MEPEFVNLCGVVDCYSQSLIEKLLEINERIHQAVDSYANAPRQSLKKKYDVSIELVGVLKAYIDIRHTCDNLMQNISKNFAAIECDSEPERENLSSSNPFLCSALDHETLSTPNQNTAETDESLGLIQNLGHPELDTQLPNVYRLIASSPKEDIAVKSEESPTRDNSNLPENQKTVKLENVIFEERELSSCEFSSSSEDFSDTESPDNSDDSAEFKTVLQNTCFDDQFVTEPLLPNEIENEKDEKSPELEHIPQSRDVTTNREATNCLEDIRVSSTEIAESAETEENIFNLGECITVKEEKFSPDVSLSKMENNDFTDVSSDTNTITNEEESPPEVVGTCSKLQGNRKILQVTFNLPELKTEKLESIAKPKLENWRLERRTQNSVNNSMKKKRTVQSQKSYLDVGQICVVCHVVSPSEFYIRTAQQDFESFEIRFNEDMNKQHFYVVNNFKNKTDAKTYLGNFCCGFLHDKRKWYRLEVVDWKMDNPSRDILVYLIDYGEKRICDYTNLKAFTDSTYLKDSNMALRCHLVGVTYPQPHNKSKWPKTSIDFFKQQCEMKKITKFIITFVAKDRFSFGVDLKKETSQSANHSLSKILILNKHVSEVKIFEKLEEEDANKVETVDEFPEHRFVEFVKDEASSGKYQNECAPKLSLPPCGQMIEVLITGYVSTCQFYVQILNNCYDTMFSKWIDKDFALLVHTMNLEDCVQSYEPFKIFPKIGQLVLVKDATNWHRGRCLRFTETSAIEVFLVDFGWKMIKHFTDLRQMKTEFLNVPFQVVECVLYNCKEKKDLPIGHSQKIFNNVMKMKTFKGLAMNSGKPLSVQLWDSDNLNLTHILKQYGLLED